VYLRTIDESASSTKGVHGWSCDKKMIPSSHLTVVPPCNLSLISFAFLFGIASDSVWYHTFTVLAAAVPVHQLAVVGSYVIKGNAVSFGTLLDGYAVMPKDDQN
jgi:hypothetical protein